MKRNMSLDVQFDEQDLVKVHSIPTCFSPLSSKLCYFLTVYYMTNAILEQGR